MNDRTTDRSAGQPATGGGQKLSPPSNYSVVFHYPNNVEIARHADGRVSVRQYLYDEDGLRVSAKNLASLRNPRFLDAYRQGMDSGHHISRPRGSSRDIGIHWRVYIACWAATHCKHLAGD